MMGGRVAIRSLALSGVSLALLTGCEGSGHGKSPSTDSAESGEPCPDTLWYLDDDRDGFGDPSSTPVADCFKATAYFADNDDDCDDDDETVYPGAPELCMDGRPNDCLDADGSFAVAACDPEGPFQAAAADAVLFGEDVAVTYGVGAYLSGAGDMDGDGHDDVLISTGNIFDGALVLGPVSGDFSLVGAQALVSGYPYTQIRPAGDMDLDGYGDLVAGEPDEARSAWVLDGPFAGEVSVLDYPSVYSDYNGDSMGTGYGVSDKAGTEVAVPGDLNGDGWQDLLVGAPAYTGAFTDSTEGYCPDESVETPEGYAVGAAYVVYGPVTGRGSLSEADGLLIGESTEDCAGYRLEPVGDLDGDGLDDIFVGAAWQCEGGEKSGAAYVVLGPASGVRSLADADMKLIGSPGDGSTMVIASAGDTNGDGYTDLLVGTSDNDTAEYGAGRASLVLGPLGEDRSLGSADARWIGSYCGYVGLSVSSAQDMDADGNADVLVGARNYQEEDTDLYATRDMGVTALTYGPIEGTLRFSDLKTVFLGLHTNGEAGASVASAGDVDADGRPDLLIGAPGDGLGAGYLILGGGGMLDGGYGP